MAAWPRGAERAAENARAAPATAGPCVQVAAASKAARGAPAPAIAVVPVSTAVDSPTFAQAALPGPRRERERGVDSMAGASGAKVVRRHAARSCAPRAVAGPASAGAYSVASTGAFIPKTERWLDVELCFLQTHPNPSDAIRVCQSVGTKKVFLVFPKRLPPPPPFGSPTAGEPRGRARGGCLGFAPPPQNSSKAVWHRI